MPPHMEIPQIVAGKTPEMCLAYGLSFVLVWNGDVGTINDNTIRSTHCLF